MSRAAPVGTLLARPFTVSETDRAAHHASSRPVPSYCDEAKINDWSCLPCQRAISAADWQVKTFTDKKTDGQVLVGAAQGGSGSGVSADGDIVVSFRGSKDFENFIKDLDFFKTAAYPKCNGCEVHGGFYTCWQALQGMVVNEVLRLRGLQPKANIFVTGHSLGASLAVLAASELHYSEGLEINGVYTFGQPRTGNGAFRDFFNNGAHVSWRVVHHRDPVPHLPLESMGFAHIATEIWYNSSSDVALYRVCDGSGEDKSCSDSEYGTDPNDHLDYLGIPTASTSCSTP